MRIVAPFLRIAAFLVGFFACYIFQYFTAPDFGEYSHFASPFALKPPEDLQKRLTETITTAPNISDFSIDNHHHLKETEDVADLLKDSVRVLCLVLTTKKYHKSRAIHVKNTWGKRCSKLIFASDYDDDEIGAIAVSKYTTYETVWGKIKDAFKYVYSHYGNDYDWFLKCDDDTYVIMENLRLTLSQFSPNEPLYMGRRFRMLEDRKGYMSGGAGYVLSRSALEQFVVVALNSPRSCRTYLPEGAEDLEMGRCLNGIGTKVAESRDEDGRQRFFPFTPISHLLEKFETNHWIWYYDFYNLHMGDTCCSESAATFHYITPKDMYILEYTVYHLKPFGVAVTHRSDDLYHRLSQNGYVINNQK